MNFKSESKERERKKHSACHYIEPHSISNSTLLLLLQFFTFNLIFCSSSTISSCLFYVVLLKNIVHGFWLLPFFLEMNILSIPHFLFLLFIYFLFARASGVWKIFMQIRRDLKFNAVENWPRILWKFYDSWESLWNLLSGIWRLKKLCMIHLDFGTMRADCTLYK